MLPKSLVTHREASADDVLEMIIVWKRRKHIERKMAHVVRAPHCRRNEGVGVERQERCRLFRIRFKRFLREINPSKTSSREIVEGSTDLRVKRRVLLGNDNWYNDPCY